MASSSRGMAVSPVQEKVLATEQTDEGVSLVTGDSARTVAAERLRSRTSPALVLVGLALVALGATFLSDKAKSHNAGSVAARDLLSSTAATAAAVARVKADDRLLVLYRTALFEKGSWTLKGYLQVGDQVVASGPPETVEGGIVVLPIKATISSDGSITKTKASVQVRWLGFDCSAGSAHWERGWSKQKQDWCCKKAGTNCEATSDKPGQPVEFDCEAGTQHWHMGWSAEKQSWCCSKTGKRCDDLTSDSSMPVHTKPIDHGDNKFDCQAGLKNWVLGWSTQKMQFCCREHGIACHVPTTTVGGVSTSGGGGVSSSSSSSTGALSTSTLTSTTTTATEPFDCDEGLEDADRGWSDWKRRWCCKFKKLGCRDSRTLSGSFSLRCKHRDELDKMPLEKKLVWQAVKDTIADLGNTPRTEGTPGTLSGPKDVLLQEWEGALPQVINMKFEVKVPADMAAATVFMRIVCERLTEALVPAVKKVPNIKEFCDPPGVENCIIDLNTLKLPCTCQNGEPKSEKNCPGKGGEHCAKCHLGYSLGSDGRCEENVCTCDNGQPAIGATCIKSGLQSCGFCQPGHHLVKSAGLQNTFLCMPNTCTCLRGTPAAGPDCVLNGAAACGSCQPGFHVDTESTKDCKPNECYCNHGVTPKDGTEACMTHQAEVCETCKSGFHLNELNLCVANVCTCSAGTRAVGEACFKDGAEICVNCNEDAFLHHDHTCGDKKCQCSDGTPVQDSMCNTNRGNQCASCNDGYRLHLPDKQCVKETCHCLGCTGATCSSCLPGYTKTADGHCTPNTCTCQFGTAAKGEQCPEDGQQLCSSCAAGYRPSRVEDAASALVIKCLPNTCTCKHGVEATSESSPRCNVDSQEHCQSCKPGYELDGRKVCRLKQCTCRHGVGTTLDHCPTAGQEACQSCDPGYELSGVGTSMLCVPEVSGVFDCKAGVAKRVLGWSDLKKDWCCQHEKIGCGNPTKVEACLPSNTEDQCRALGCCVYDAVCAPNGDGLCQA